MTDRETKAIEAAELLKEYCDNVDCSSCIFRHYGVCMFVDEDYEYASDYIPRSWDVPPIRQE